MLLNCGVWRRLLRVPWTDCKEIQPVHPKGDQSWMFIGWSQGWNWMWQVALTISWLTQGLPTLYWPPTLESSPSKSVPFGALQEKQLLKDSPEWCFVCGMDQYFPTSFWWSLSVLFPYWDEIYLLNWGPPLWWEAFQPLEPYSFWLLLNNPMHFLQ